MKLLAGFLFLVASLMGACQTKHKAVSPEVSGEEVSSQDVSNAEVNMNRKYPKITKTDAEWKSQLSELEYKVLRHEGTERSFTGEYWETKLDGQYACRGCYLPLFDSKTKYKSGTGWPSFYEPLEEECVEFTTDRKLGYQRKEVHCARCDGHLGHVFNDGPDPTGLRYCINSASLFFQERVTGMQSK